MKHMHTTSVGLAKAAWLHKTQLTTKHKYQHKHDNSRHSLQNTCMQKTSVELFAAGCLHNALEEATCEKGTIQIFTQGMNEVIFLEKHLFLQKGEPGGCFQNTRNMTQRWDYTVTCALSDLMLDQLWPRNTLAADRALEVEKVWSLILFFLFPK